MILGSGYTWHAPGGRSGQPVHPTTIYRSPSTRVQQQRRGGVLGALLAGGAAFFKYGIALLKFGKLGGTMISFLISVLIYIGIFGWEFGIGALLLIAIHESGHMLFARIEHMQVRAPIFLGPFGAMISTRGSFRDARQEAVVAIGGPVVGTAAALLCYIFAQSLPTGHLHYLLLALAYFGCLVNLFNLIPMSPLDGGRVASAVSKWANVAGLAIIVALIGSYYVAGNTPNPFLFLILLFGVFSTVGRFRRSARGQDPPPIAARTRLAIGLAYASILVVSAVGMTIAHSSLLGAGIGQTVS